MKKVITLACFMLLLILTNCNHSLIQVDGTEFEITEAMTVIDIPIDQSPATSITLSEFGDIEEINISQYVTEI